MHDRPATLALSVPSDHSSASSSFDRVVAGTAGDAIWLVARCLIGGIFVQSAIMGAFLLLLVQGGRRSTPSRPRSRRAAYRWPRSWP
jgi:hypothetical protein